MRNFVRDYSLSLLLALLFVVSWVVQTVAGWIEFAAEQTAHDETARAFGPDGYVWPWLKATMENWQSEFLQLFTFVTLTAILIHRKSHESRDDQDKMAQQIEEILSAVQTLQRAGDAKK